MKAPNKGNRPLPILFEDGGDYIGDSSFKTVAELVSSPGPSEAPIYKYSLRVDLKCPPLEALLKEGKAMIKVCLEQDTMRKFLDYEDGMVIEVDASTLRLSANLDITPVILAVGPGDLEYDPSFMEDMYGLFNNRTFRFENRQILGYGQVIHLKTNPIKGLGQIIAIREMKKRDPIHPFTLELSGDKIVINANQEITKNIKLIQMNSQELEGLVNSSFAYVVFFHVIETMIAQPQSYSSLRWYNAIVGKINKVREQKNMEEFDPETFQSQYSGANLHDEIWTLTSQLLTDNNGQLMLLAFERAGTYSEGQ